MSASSEQARSGPRSASGFSPQDVPRSAGVYIFRNAAGEVIYVGKAKSLRKRLASYFQPSRSRRADPKLRALINSIDTYEVVVVKSEAEALLLESRLIKEYHPRYNVMLRDDKRFLHICIDLSEPFPRLQLVRLRKNDGRVYIGPFPYAGVLRQTVQFLSKRYGLRTCKVRHPDAGTMEHCLEHVMQQCMCPCGGKVTEARYRARVEEVIDVLEGNAGELIDELEEAMKTHAAQLAFEDAAAARDMAENLRAVCNPWRRRFTRAGLDTETESPGMSAVRALQDALGMDRAPRVIECFDMSNIAGRFGVGSMVCFRDGRPSKRDYRRYRIRSDAAAGDTDMMREVLVRRYRRLRTEQAPFPDLIVLDGGDAQVSTAMAVLTDLGEEPRPVLGLAKRREEIHLPGRRDPLALPANHSGLHLLQAVRDEAHRFANSYNRELRRQRISNSILLEIPGVGTARAQRLLAAMGSVKRVRDAAVPDIAAAVPGLGPVMATRIKQYLVDHSGPSSG